MSQSDTNMTNVHQGEILLESGTNELEVLVFGLGTGTYGINVAKVPRSDPNDESFDLSQPTAFGIGHVQSAWTCPAAD